MNNIYFRNTKRWFNVYATLLSKDESVKEIIKLDKKIRDNDKDYILEFDNTKYDHLYFHNSLKEKKKTSKIFVGNSTIGVEFKRNKKTKKNLTFLYSKGVGVTGKVDTYILEDKEYLSYRKGTKKINVFVPSSYKDDVKYDILYFFDAQNLFAQAGHYTENADPYGGWELDIVLNSIYKQYGKNIIVVAIDNADEYRSEELFMDHTSFGKLSSLATGDIPEEIFRKGHLDELSSFMRKTVHPLIKEKYSVKEDNIGIGGSSMGGIAGFYCSLKELGFYKYCLSYSPAYGLYEMEAYENYFDKLNFKENKDKLPKLHIYCGSNDPLEKQLEVASRKMKEVLVKHGYDESLIYETYDVDKVHNEEAWRLILLDSFNFLLDLNK